MSSSLNAGAASGALPTVSRQDATILVRQVNRLLNRQLSSVCQLNGLKSGGVKAELQSRIANREYSPLLHLCFTSRILEKGIHCFLLKPTLTFLPFATSVIQDALNTNDGLRFQQIRQSVQNTIVNASGASSTRSPLIHAQPISAPTPPPSMPYSHGEYGRGHANGHRPAASSPSQSSRLNFKSSPFYQIENAVSDVRTCEGQSIHLSILGPRHISNYHF